MNTETQVCRTCNEELPISRFGLASRNPSGRNYHCKECAQKRRVANDERRFESMSIDQLKDHEERTRVYRRRAASRNPERKKAQAARSRIMCNIPKWIDELDIIEPILRDYEKQARPHFEEFGNWPAELAHVEGDGGMSWAEGSIGALWSDTTGRLSWLRNKLNSMRLPCGTHDTVVYRTKWLQDKLDATSAEDQKTALQRRAAGGTGGSGLPRSLVREMEVWKLEDEEFRRSLPPEQRAESSAYWNAVWYQLELAPDELTAGITGPDNRDHADEKLAEWRRGGCRYGEVTAAENKAMDVESQQAAEDMKVIQCRYDEVYPKFLEIELAKDAALAAEKDATTESSAEKDAEKDVAPEVDPDSLLGPVDDL